MWRLANALALACVGLALHLNSGAAQQVAYSPAMESLSSVALGNAPTHVASSNYYAAGLMPAGYPLFEGHPQSIDDTSFPQDLLRRPGVGMCESSLCRNAKVWASAQSVFSFQKSRRLPTLVTSSPAGPPATSQLQAGVLGLPTTTIRFGDNNFDNNPQLGFGGELGLWLQRFDGRKGVGVAFTYLPEDEIGFTTSSNGSPILARPFFDTLNNVQASQLVAYPGLVNGQVNIKGGTEIRSGELFLRHQIGACPRTPRLFFLAGEVGTCLRYALNLPCMHRVPGVRHLGGGVCNVLTSMPETRLDLITGLRFTRIDDRLLVNNSLISLDPAFLGQVGTTLDAFDLFDTRNEFHGSTIGMKSVSRYGCWTLSLAGKVALGRMRQEVTIDGQTVTSLPGVVDSTSEGGLLAQPGQNIGNYERTRFGVNPEAQISLSYDLTCRLRLGAGYQFMYWNDIVVAGDQVNLAMDITQSQINDDPFEFHQTDHFVHAATLFLHWNY